MEGNTEENPDTSNGGNSIQEVTSELGLRNEQSARWKDFREEDRQVAARGAMFRDMGPPRGCSSGRAQGAVRLVSRDKLQVKRWAPNYKNLLCHAWQCGLYPTGKSTAAGFLEEESDIISPGC